MSKSILVFDSGIGGLTILEEIRQLLPNENYLYLFDNARLPYGELSESELITGCVGLITEFVNQHEISIVVIACNTASTLILPSLRAVLNIPIVGVVPAIKPAAALSEKKHIGLLATPGTIKRTYTHELITQFADGCEVDLYASSELVLLAEQKAAGMKVTQRQIAEILLPIFNSELDTLVLGCTHFPVLKAEMQEYLGKGVTLVDSGKAIAARVVSLVEQQAFIAKTKDSEKTTCSTDILDCAYYTASEIEEGIKLTLMDFGLTNAARMGTMFRGGGEIHQK